MDKFLSIEVLEANATRIEDFGYLKHFTEEELDSFKEDIAETSIEINDLEDEKKGNRKRDQRKRSKKAKEQRREALGRFKDKSEHINEKMLCSY